MATKENKMPPAYERCKIGYVHMLLFLLAISETSCKSHKYDDTHHKLLNGEVEVYIQHARDENSLMKHANKVVERVKYLKILSDENSLSSETKSEELVQTTISSEQNERANISTLVKPSVVEIKCKEVLPELVAEQPSSPSPQLIALAAALAAIALCAVLTLLALLHARRSWQCTSCQETARKAAHAYHARRLSIDKPEERSKMWARDPSPYPMRAQIDAERLDAAGDVGRARAQYLDAYAELVGTSPTSSVHSHPSSRVNALDEDPEGAADNRDVRRLPVSFHYKPQFSIRPHSPPV